MQFLMPTLKIPKGFTLIELMIIIAIIGVLVTTVAPAMSGYVMRARDTARLSDLYNIGLALGSYELEQEAYPDHASGCYPALALSGKYINKQYISPSGTSYNEGCGPSGLYGYKTGIYIDDNHGE
jgi:prepilin-type N-terminal cleavage/methylation domain-containing protein